MAKKQSAASPKKHHLIAQAREIAEMKRRKHPFRVRLAGHTLIVYPNIYPGGRDSELMCKRMVIHRGDDVLDLCAGTGIIGIAAAKRGASSVTCVDLNPFAVASAKANKQKMRLGNLEVLQGKLFQPVKDRRFDVITCNPPYTDKRASDATETCFWDQGNRTTVRFFQELPRHLKLNGRAYIGWANFASVTRLKHIADRFSLRLRRVGMSRSTSGHSIFYVFQILSKKT